MFIALVLVVLLLLVPVPLASAQRPGQPLRQPMLPPQPLLPSQPPPPPAAVVPPARACYTEWGACAIPCCVAPGTPCYCVTPRSTWLPGYAVEYPWPLQ